MFGDVTFDIIFGIKSFNLIHKFIFYQSVLFHIGYIIYIFSFFCYVLDNLWWYYIAGLDQLSPHKMSTLYNDNEDVDDIRVKIENIKK